MGVQRCPAGKKIRVHAAPRTLVAAAKVAFALTGVGLGLPAAQDWAKKHELDRKRITQVVCALCGERQAVGTACTACGASFGAYACTRCPFFDDDLGKMTFHCDECGICRVGGRENYFHCDTCGSCYAANLRASRPPPGAASAAPALV